MEIQLQQFLLQIVNFGIIFGVLSFFAYKPVLKILDERANKIKDGISAAEKSILERVKIEETKRKELTKAQKEAAAVLEEAQKKAEKLGNEIIEKAKSEAQKAVQNEEKQLMERMQREEDRLKKEIASLVVQSTESVLKGGLDKKTQSEIIKNQIKELKNLKV